MARGAAIEIVESSRSGGIGRRGGLKHRCLQRRQGSSPCFGTKLLARAIAIDLTEAAARSAMDAVCELLVRDLVRRAHFEALTETHG